MPLRGCLKCSCSWRFACIRTPALCIQSPSSCLCHVAVRDRFAGPSSSVLYWSGLERSDTLSKRLRVILYVLVTRSNTSLVPPAPESRYWGALCEGSFLVQNCIECHTVTTSRGTHSTCIGTREIRDKMRIYLRTIHRSRYTVGNPYYILRRCAAVYALGRLYCIILYICSLLTARIIIDTENTVPPS